MLAFLYVYLFDALLVCAVLAAWQWGGRTERSVAGCYMAAAVLSVMLGSREAAGWSGFQSGLLLVDAALLCALGWFAVRTGKTWIVVSAALHLLSTLAHFASWAGAAFWKLGYALMEGASSYPSVILLGFAIWRHHIEHARRTSSPGSSLGAAVRSRTASR